MSEISSSNSQTSSSVPRKSQRHFVLLGIAGVLAIGGAVYARQRILSRPPTPDAIISKSKMGMAVVGELETLQAKVKANPNDVAIRIQLVRLYQRLQLIDLGIEQLREIVRLQPEKLDHRLILGNAFLAKGNGEEAAGVFVETARKWTNSTEAYQGLSAALFVQKRYLEAMQAAKQAVKLSPDDPNNRFALGAAALEYAMQFPDPEIHSDELFVAKKEFEALSKIWTDNGDIFYRLGKVYVELRVRKQAIVTLEKAYKMLPERGDVAFELARTYNLSGTPDKALNICEDAIAKGTDSFLLYELAGSLYLNRGTMDNVEKAVAMYRKAASLRPDAPRTLDKLGVALLKVGKVDEARQAFEKSLMVNPNRAFPYQQMATIYTRMRLPDRAKIAADMARKMTANEQQLKQLQELSKVNADDINLRLILADRYRDLTLFGPAKDEYYYVLKIAPQNPRALAGLKALEAAMTAPRTQTPPAPQNSASPTTTGKITP